MMEYALFRRLKGEWSILYTYSRLKEAEAERLYWTQAYGVPVQVFARWVPNKEPMQPA